MKMRTVTTISILAAAMLCGACASHTGSEEAFGDSVRSVVHNQTYDKNAAANPSSLAITGGNADRIEMVVEGHAGTTSDAAAIARPIRIGTGSQ